MKVSGLLSIVALAGFCKRTPPVVGFQSDAAPHVTSPTDATTDAAADAGHFAVVDGRPVTGDGLTVDGATIAPPAGTSFGVWVPVDLDGDGQATDVAVTAVGSDHTARPLMFFHRDDTGFSGVTVADVVPGDPRCAETSLRLTSPRSLVVGWRCAGAAADAGNVGAHTQEEALIALSATPAVRERAALRAPDPIDGPLTLSLTGSDRDGDGVDEVEVAVSTGGQGARRSSVRAVFFARGGGLARDTSEPAASFAALFERARHGVSARRRTSLANALASFDDAARLRRAVCQGSGGVRLDLHGAGFPCEGVNFGAAPDAMARALMAGGELPAAWAMTRLETASAWGVVSNARVLAELRRVTTPERGVVARRGPSLPSAPPIGRMGARLSSLAFDAQVNPTALNVRGASTGTIELTGLTWMPSGGGTEADLLARSPDGTTAIVGFAETCRGLAAVRCSAGSEGCAAMALHPSGGEVPAGGEVVALGTAIAPSLAPRCGSAPGASEWLGSTPRAAVLAWTGAAAVLGVQGRVATLSGATVTYGDTAGVAVASPEGVWVRDRTGWKLLAPPELAGRYATLTDLVVSGDGRRVAAMIGVEVWLLERARAAGH